MNGAPEPHPLVRAIEALERATERLEQATHRLNQVVSCMLEDHETMVHLAERVDAVSMHVERLPCQASVPP